MASAAENLPLPRMLIEQLVSEKEKAFCETEIARIASSADPPPEAASDDELGLGAEMFLLALRLVKSLGPKAAELASGFQQPTR